MNKSTKITLTLGGMLSLALLTGCTPSANKTATTQPNAQTPEKPRIPDFPKLEGKPEVGKWYGVYPKGAKTALGEAYHGTFKLGSSRNVMVLFNGGGVSVDAHTATERTFNTDPRGDVMQMFGLGGGSKESPFADWTVINLPYATGDFHAGAGDFAFKNEKTGAADVLHHTGATNFDLVMNEVRQYVGTPDKLLVAGYSAGGFATALMSERVMGYFPETENVTVAVDGALLLSGKWHDIAKNVWHSPKDITDRLTTNNLTLDSLTALSKAHPDVKVLFMSTPRDEELVNVQNYLSTGKMVKTTEGGVQFQKDLTEFVAALRKNVPNTAFYIFAGDKKDPMGLTTHTALMLTSFMPLNDITPAEWISRAVNGKLEDHGLDLLGK